MMRFAMLALIAAPPAVSRAEWAKVEEAGWHRQMRSRAGGQNENARIGH